MFLLESAEQDITFDILDCNSIRITLARLLLSDKPNLKVRPIPMSYNLS